MRKICFAIFLAVFAALAATPSYAQSATPQSAATWSYYGKTGALLWGKLDPSFQACSKGQQQSPMDIRGARLNKALEPIEFHYVSGPTTLTNDGHTVQVQVNPVSYIVVEGTRYTLLGYEFHHPSEHTVRGKLSDMEVDLIHRSDDGKFVILGVLLSETMGAPNATLASLWQHLPTAAGKSDKDPDMVSSSGLLPADKGYWTYTGSQLTPPCTEGVKWFVFENEVSISRDQYRAFSDMYKMNTRPLQDPHGRKIEANE